MAVSEKKLRFGSAQVLSYKCRSSARRRRQSPDLRRVPSRRISNAQNQDSQDLPPPVYCVLTFS